jgi:thiol-disulfide isomerase/thioredoxin
MIFFQSRLFPVLFGVALLAFSGLAQALEIKPYSREAFAAVQASGKSSALHFHAPWCGTCVSQEAALKTLQTEKALPGVTVFVVDYDSNKPLRKDLKVRSQSMFVVYKGSTEVARSGGDTKADKIRALLSKAI